jgi:hypothetical protein
VNKTWITPPSPPSWAHLFPEGDFEWAFRMRPGDPLAFFRGTEAATELLKQKSDLIASHPERHLAIDPRAQAFLPKLLQQLSAWDLDLPDDIDGFDELTTSIEPDFLLMEQANQELIAASVCFPSSWDPAHWMGEPLTRIHDVVPRLNPQIGPMIEKFFRQLKPGRAAQRANWSVTWGNELNYHPALKRLPIDASTPIEEVYLRLEHQIFTAIPGAVLMGIRIEPVPLTSLAAHSPLWQHLLQKLDSMPEDVARYKSLERGLSSLVEQMRKIGKG